VPGDVIGSGTVGGGCIAELSARHGARHYPWLRPGDEVVIEVAHLGRLAHRIVPGAPLHPLRPEDPAAVLAAVPTGSGT
jgi:2-keto-4-pentenoate hydratase/2-oxohepta-3-ene-1,7-dioic acid hydratase in catechol pathway